MNAVKLIKAIILFPMFMVAVLCTILIIGLLFVEDSMSAALKFCTKGGED